MVRNTFNIVIYAHHKSVNPQIGIKIEHCLRLPLTLHLLLINPNSTPTPFTHNGTPISSWLGKRYLALPRVQRASMDERLSSSREKLTCDALPAVCGRYEEARDAEGGREGCWVAEEACTGVYGY